MGEINNSGTENDMKYGVDFTLYSITLACFEASYAFHEVETEISRVPPASTCNK